jgi:hypothetical protein
MAIVAKHDAARDRRSRQAERDQDARKLEASIDEALVETFPASDPPWFMGGTGRGWDGA